MLPLLLVGAVVVLLPLSAILELPLERRVKSLLGIDYGECGVRHRGRFGAWRNEGHLPGGPVEEGRAVRVRNAAYVAGGVVTPVVDYVAQSTAAFRRYDLRRKRWTSLPSLPRPLNHVGIAAKGNSIYVVGGLGNRLEYLSIASREMWRYDIRARRWHELPPMPTARGALGITIVGDDLYAIGGRDGPRSLAIVETYDIRRRKWTERAPLPFGRDHLGAAAFRGHIYVVAGRYDGGNELHSFLRYDPRRNRWSRRPPLPIGTSGVDLNRVGDQLVVAGGEDSEQAWVTGQNFAYDPHQGRWRELPPTPQPTHGYASVGDHIRLYVFGGSSCAGSTPSAAIQSLRVSRR